MPLVYTLLVLCLLISNPVLLSASENVVDFTGDLDGFGTLSGEFEALSLHHRSRRNTLNTQLTYTQEDIDDMLNAHNSFRRMVTPLAADMNLLTWDTTLASAAEAWSAQCTLSHGHADENSLPYNGNVFQNLYIGSMNVVHTRSVEGWYEENEYFDYETYTCDTNQECGHYEVITFAALDVVGCATALCTKTNGVDVKYVVCYYGPAGTEYRPFMSGPACAKCASGSSWCYDGLCDADCDQSDSQCQCNLICHNCGVLNQTDCSCTCKTGWLGQDCSEPCANSENCYYSESSSCVNAGVVSVCAVLCNTCTVAADEQDPNNICCGGMTCSTSEILDENCQCVDYYTYAISLSPPETVSSGGPSCPCQRRIPVM